MSKRKIKTPGVYLDKNGTYYLKYKNKTFRGFETVEDAEIKKAQLMLGEEKIKSSITVHQVAIDFLKHEYDRVNNNEIKYGTYTHKEQLYRNYIKGHLENQKMHHLSMIKLRNFRSAIGSLELSTRQKNYILQITKQIIKHGVRYFEVKVDNTIELEPFTKNRSEVRDRLSDLRNVLSDQEFLTFIKYVSEVDYHYLFLILYLTGARLGEVLALKWTDFDVETKTLDIHKNLTNKTTKTGYELIDTKTASSDRVIRISDQLSQELETLKSYKQTFVGFKDSWFILGHSKPLSTTTVTRKKNQAIEDSGVKYFTNHQLRHSFVTNAFNRGEQLVSISSYIGHKNIGETMRTYAHLSAEGDDRFTQYINNSSQNLLTR